MSDNKMTGKEFQDMMKRRAASKNGKRTGSESANALTNSALVFLNSSGFVAWRNNTTGIFDPGQASKLLMAYIRCVMSGSRTPNTIMRIVNRSVNRGDFRISDIRKLLSSSFRKHHGIKGVPDIIGYEWKNNTGRFIGVEIKAGKDRESVDQKTFRMTAQRRGTWSITIRCMDDLIQFLDEVQPLAKPKK